jgi:hypothetical protein
MLLWAHRANRCRRRSRQVAASKLAAPLTSCMVQNNVPASQPGTAGVSWCHITSHHCAVPAAIPVSATRRESRRCRQASTSCLRCSSAACRRWAEYPRAAAWMGAAACCGWRTGSAEARCASCWLLGCLLSGPGMEAVDCRRRVPASKDGEGDPLLLRERGGRLRLLLPPVDPAAGHSKGGRLCCVLPADLSAGVSMQQAQQRRPALA